MMRPSHTRIAPPSWLRRPRRTARRRLTALYGGLFLLFGTALVAITYVLFERATEYRTPHLPTVPNTPAIQSLQLLPSPADALLQLGQVQQQLAQDQHQLTNPSGVSVGTGGQLEQQVSQVQQHLIQDQHQLAQAQHRLALAVHQVAQTGTIQAAQRATDSHQLLVNSGIALAIVAVLALVAGWFVAGRMLRPIRAITRTARRISSTSLHERLALDGPQDELKELGDTLDELFGRLDAAFEAQRHFVANASHELRTPLTRERALIQVALGDPSTSDVWKSTGQELLAANREQETLIEALLALASSESGLNGREPVDLAVTVTNTLVDLRSDIDSLRIRVDEVTTPTLIEGDPLLVERLVANLLTNAVRHNVLSGRIEIVTRVDQGKAVLSVTNTGPFIPPGEVDRLFQPFQRLEPRRVHYKDGHGLGLSIVEAIATAHQASIIAKPMPDGGLSVSVIFPKPSDQPVAFDRRSNATETATTARAEMQ
jgi:signal transduction histidine kinase